MTTTDDPYCYFDLDDSGTLDVCATFVEYTTTTPEGPDNTNQMCVTEDGRLMRGNTASTRARTNLRGFDSSPDDDVDAVDSGWVILAYEESKGLGEDAATDKEDIAKYDMGKNIWYHTFNMFEPELVSQGMMLNQPAIYPDDVAWVDEFAPDESELIGTVKLIRKMMHRLTPTTCRQCTI